MSMRNEFAMLAANTAARISPWWRFRLWVRLTGGNPYEIREPVAPVWMRVQPHGYEMELSRSDWMERYAIQFAHYYQDDAVAVLRCLLRPGDTFIDVGANLGFLALTAARQVGSTGRVLAFEANRELTDRLMRVVHRNRIDNLTVLSMALGATNGHVVLTKGKHHGTNFIDFSRPPTPDESIAMRRADEVIPADALDARLVLVKIDVEGAELAVLQGMPRLLARRNVQFLVEVGDKHARKFGWCSNDIFQLFGATGYRAYLPRLSPFADRLRMRQLSGPIDKTCYDVLFRRG